MPIFPDLTTEQFFRIPEIVSGVIAEGILGPSSTVEWNFWGYATLVPLGNYQTGQRADIYGVPYSLKNFYAIPVWPGGPIEISNVRTDVPAEAPDTLRYSVEVSNAGQTAVGYRLFIVTHGIDITNGGQVDVTSNNQTQYS